MKPGSWSPAAIFGLARSIGAPTSLEAIGMPADGIDAAARRVVDEAAANVRPPDEASIQRMLDDAFHGRVPASPGTHRVVNLAVPGFTTVNELEPLTRNLDRLLKTERANQARYRNALDSLAHSLKTPLAVLKAGQGEAADPVAKAPP